MFGQSRGEQGVCSPHFRGQGGNSEARSRDGLSADQSGMFSLPRICLNSGMFFDPGGLA